MAQQVLALEWLCFIRDHGQDLKISKEARVLTSVLPALRRVPALAPSPAPVLAGDLAAEAAAGPAGGQAPGSAAGPELAGRRS